MLPENTQLDESFPLTVEMWLREVRMRFEADCKEHRARRPEDYLDGAEGPVRAALLRDLQLIQEEFAKGALGSPRLPGYLIEGELGKGGMGVVYKAGHEALRRTVALKMIRAGAHARPEELARFKAEAQTVARLEHPNIVKIYDVGEHDGLPYFSLEYVEGGSLARKIR